MVTPLVREVRFRNLLFLILIGISPLSSKDIESSDRIAVLSFVVGQRACFVVVVRPTVFYD